MGPFYCPTDTNIYLDTEFFNELSQRFQAPGDFAMAYVVAHEVGHHVQDLMGTLGKAEKLQASESETQANATQVKIELQADCYAGVWAAHAKNPEGQSVMEPGDFEEGMRAAEAIGDDTLQKETQGRVVPDSFTHGTSAQRMNALRTGFQSGNPDSCASL
jgi:predicted metalloprotease